MTMNEMQLSKNHYAPSPVDFVEGFSRVQRISEAHVRRMSEQQRRAHALRESRIASAAQLIADVVNGVERSYMVREALNPSSPQMAALINARYPGVFRPMTAHETHLAEAMFGSSISESMTTSDFPLLVGDVLDRMLLQRFTERPQVWRQYIHVGRPLRDFRTTRLIQTDGGDGQWDEITEEEGLTYTTISESGHTISPALYGKAVRLAWRLLINDDLDAFAEIPAVLGRGGRRTISKFATNLLFDSNGPDATFISAGNGNLLTGNPDLAIDSLGTAIGVLAGFTDSEGEPIMVEGIRLVHGPGLKVVANNLINQLTVDITEVGGVANRTVRVNNWIVQGLTLTEDPYIPIIATTNGATSWLLAADPNVNRPAARVRFLAGFEQPALYQKAPNTMRVGGGLDEGVGDFQSMSTEYKGLVAFGGSTIEPKSVVGSNGSNT
jgi:hypothetical protein